MTNFKETRISKKFQCIYLTNNKSYHKYFSNSKNTLLSNMNELNNILTDLKDRLTVLEVTQNTSHNNPLDNAMNKNNNNLLNRNILNTGNYSYPGIMNENIFLNMESILKRIDRVLALMQIPHLL